MAGLAILVGSVILLLGVSSARAGIRQAAVQPEVHANGLVTCSVDLRVQHLRGFYTDQHGRRFGSSARLADWLAETGEHLDCAVNGGIFGLDQSPLGLFVADGLALYPLNAASDRPGNFFLQPNGALIVRDETAQVITTAELAGQLSDLADVDLAVQSGPMLLQSGSVSARLDPASQSRFTRDAVCIVDQTHVVLAYSPEPVSLFELAVALQSIGCRDALYLDGHLSQMYPFDRTLSLAQRQDISTIIGVTSRIKP
jgi:uncharacterized protein YigE (DUF2233 family)